MIIRLVRHINTKRAFKSASLGRWGGILQEDSDHKNIDKNTRLLSTVGGNMSREDAEEIIKIGDTDLDNKLNIMEFLGRFNLFL